MFVDQGIEVKADPLSLEALIAWLEKQLETKIYCYDDLGRCLAAQYNASIGREYKGCYLAPGPDLTFDRKLERIAIRKPHTFGAALTRAREALASR